MQRPAAKLDTQGETFGKRIAAFLIDGIVLTVAMMVVGMLSIFAIGGGSRAMARVVLAVQALAVLAMFAYFIVLEGLYGQTLGKKAMGIVVVNDDGSDSTVVGSLVRNVLRIVDALPFLYLLGIVAILLTDGNQRVGDLAASTYVVETA